MSAPDREASPKIVKARLSRLLLWLGVACVGYFAWIKGDAAYHQYRAVKDFETALAQPATTSTQPLRESEPGLKMPADRRADLFEAHKPAPAKPLSSSQLSEVTQSGLARTEARTETRAEARGVPAQQTAEAANPDMSLWSDSAKTKYESSLQVDLGKTQALLSIPKIAVKVPVFNGASDINLDRGVARIQGTGDFTYFDNVGIAGHRDSYFRRLSELKLEDKIHLTLPDGQVREFSVSDIDIVMPENTQVLMPTNHDSITLVTCYPFYFLGNAPKRYIVKAVAS